MIGNRKFSSSVGYIPLERCATMYQSFKEHKEVAEIKKKKTQVFIWIMSYKSQFRKQANQRLERNIPPVGRMFPKLPHTGSLYLTLKYLWQEQQVRWVVGLYCGPKKMIIYFFLGATASQMSFCTWSATPSTQGMIRGNPFDHGQPAAGAACLSCRLCLRGTAGSLCRAHTGTSTSGHKHAWLGR